MKQVRVETGVVHLRVGSAQSLRTFLENSDLEPLSIRPTPELVDEWLHYGSVYVEGLRARRDRPLESGQVLRLHTRRKRYVSRPLASRIVLNEEEFLVLDKPAGLPTHPTLDNYVENAQYVLEQELGYPIYVTHRLDIATQGLLILAKNKSAQALINKLFSEGRVEKAYRAYSREAVPLGPHTHFMDPESHVPKIVSGEAHAAWWECRLEVESCTQDPLGYLSQIRLLTGKTHQIRAQFAAIGAPILGDETYGSREKSPVADGIALACHRLRFQFRSPWFEITRPE